MHGRPVTARVPEALRYRLYEASVQTPEIHVEFFQKIFRDLRKGFASRLREDFCGTFRISIEWVKRNRRNEAVGLDLDPEPLRYGLRNHLGELKPKQRSRLKVLQQDVLKPKRSAPFDLIAACNFSFFIFKERKTLLRYFKAARRALSPKGVFILELAGGPGMVRTCKERKTVKTKAEKFTYIWDQKAFDPIRSEAHYAIHFELSNGTVLKDCFTYDWRIWNIREVQDALAEAGFKRSVVYWETAHKGAGTGEYALAESGDNAYAWIAYVVGLR